MKTLEEFMVEARQHQVDEGLGSYLLKKAAPYVMPVVRKGTAAVEKLADKANKALAPSIPTQRLGDIPIKTTVLGGRALDRGEKIVKYTRNMDPAELAHANKTGYFLPKAGEPKYWTPHGEKGVLGRQYKQGAKKPEVSIPAKDFNPNKAVPITNATIGNKSVIDKSLGARISRVGYKAGRVLGINEDV